MKRSLAIAALLTAVLLLPMVNTGWGQLLSSHASPAASAPPGVVAGPQLTGKAVARVNGTVLTDRDLLREEYTIFPYARQHNGAIPKGMEPDIRAGALKMIVFEELVYQEAVRRKLVVPPARVHQAEAEFRKQFPNPADYEQLIKAEFKSSDAVLRGKIERSLLIEQVLKSEVEEKAFVTVEQARTFYNQNPKRFLVPESFTVQTISIIPPNNATPEQVKEARKKAEDAYRQAKEAKTYDQFGLLAEKISEDDYHVMMGDHKSVDKSKLPPQVLKAVQGMQSQQVSGLIDVGNNAYTIVRLNAHVPAGKRAFGEVRESLREYLKRQKIEALRGQLNQRLRKTAKVEEL